MNDFFLILTILAVPIFILLFVRQIKRKKVAYSFTFLQRFKSQSLKQIFLKIIHLFYDIIFDILIAIILALIFSNIIFYLNQSNKVAFVLDGSYSMMKIDSNGVTPFEKAVLYYYSHKNDFKSFDLYAAVFDLDNAKSEIVSLNKMRGIVNPKIFIDQFSKSFSTFEFDVDELSDKRLRKYKKVIFLTDLFPYHISTNKIGNLEIIEVGHVQKDFFYPVSLIYEPATDFIYCNFIKSKGNYLPKVEVFDKNKLFIKAEDKVKLDFNNENSIYLKTNEKSLFKVSLFNQSYYIDLTNISPIVESSGKYANLLKTVIFQSSGYEEELQKLKQRGFVLTKDSLPVLVIYQGDIKDDFAKKLLKIKNPEKIIYYYNFNQGNIDLIFDTELTAGLLLGTSEEALKQEFLNLKKQKISIVSSPMYYDEDKKVLAFPISISDKYLMKPQTIIYFYLITKVFENKVAYSQSSISNFIINLTGKETKLKKMDIIEQNYTSILYKEKDKLIYKNININEIYQYKISKDFQIRYNNIADTFYLIILALLFLSKFITFMFLKNR
ncbi:MAG: hypothetical protein NUV32_01985 [Exilispira sp.]|jgi:hypothetical protein|nr:hypothetical protein [Exilispira sp.]